MMPGMPAHNYGKKLDTLPIGKIGILQHGALVWSELRFDAKTKQFVASDGMKYDEVFWTSATNVSEEQAFYLANRETVDAIMQRQIINDKVGGTYLLCRASDVVYVDVPTLIAPFELVGIDIVANEALLKSDKYYFVYSAQLTKPLLANAIVVKSMQQLSSFVAINRTVSEESKLIEILEQVDQQVLEL